MSEENPRYGENIIRGEVGRRLDLAVAQSAGGEGLIARLLTALRGRFWGSVIVASHGEVLLAKGYGQADYRSQPNTPATLFEIASVSKWFTAAAILKLEEQGKLSTAQSIASVLSSVPADKQAITIQHLLTHTSGLPSMFGLPYDAPESRDEFVQQFLSEPLEFSPGERFEYCNSGYALLAAIIEQTAGVSFEQFLREELFKPAGMHDTGFIGDHNLKWSRAAARREPSLFARRVDGSAVFWHWSWGYRGMGGVVTTVHDLVRWDQSLRQGRPLSMATQEKQMTPALDGAACGCFVNRTAWGSRRV